MQFCGPVLRALNWVIIWSARVAADCIPHYNLIYIALYIFYFVMLVLLGISQSRAVLCVPMYH